MKRNCLRSLSGFISKWKSLFYLNYFVGPNTTDCYITQRVRFSIGVKYFERIKCICTLKEEIVLALKSLCELRKVARVSSTSRTTSLFFGKKNRACESTWKSEGYFLPSSRTKLRVHDEIMRSSIARVRETEYQKYTQAHVTHSTRI